MKPDAKDLFAYALELTGEDREAYLRDACGNDAELRLEVQNLLVKAAKADSFFGDDDGATLGAEEFKETYAEKEGDTVGPFKLRQPIGEGGFGIVWMAEQSVPISRMVALKVIKAGMDTKQVLARFEAERQALAMMDHPNIAKVLDAGATATGRPWFAMELVKGIPITEYCDQAGLGTRERLALFGDVCSAINHAHQKGIIHRDIKPSNVMVTLHGDKPVVKVIDFGIAKATQGKLTDQTLFTRFEQFIGTPVYMSPEQAAMSGLDIDTRSDIYALGILLYELLVGKPPFDSKSLVSAGYDEMRRIIREVEPPKPSSRLGTIMGPERTQLAKARHIEEGKLNKMVEPDLDWIVMKAIDKDRTRRYETANAFAQDIVRFLGDEAVTARPPSAGYQLQKFARRNKAAFRVAAMIAGLLVAATLVSSWQAVRATKAEKLAAAETERTKLALADAEAVSKFMTDMFDRSQPGEEKGGREVKVVDVLDPAVAALEANPDIPPARRAKLQASLGRTYHALGLYPQAIPLQEKVLDHHLATHGPEHPDTLAAMNALAAFHLESGRRDEALEMLEEVLALSRKVNGPEHPDTLNALSNLAVSCNQAGRLDEALKMGEEVLALFRRVRGPEHPATLAAMGNLATSYSAAGRREEALEMGEEVLALRRKVLGDEHPETLKAINILANAYYSAGRRDEALKMIEEVLPLSRKVLGDEHPGTLRVIINNLAASYLNTGRQDEALEMGEEGLALSRKVNGPDHPSTLAAMHNLANLYDDAGRRNEALEMGEKVLDLSRKVNGPEHPSTLNAMHNLAASYHSAGRRDEAIKMKEEVLALRRKVLGPEHPDTLMAMQNLAVSYSDAGREDEALKMREEVLAPRRKVLGPEHPDTLRAMQNLAVSYEKSGETGKADALRAEVSAINAKLAVAQAKLFWGDRASDSRVIRLLDAGLRADAFRKEPDGTWTVNLRGIKDFSDLALFTGTPVSGLFLDGTGVTDLEPLRGMPLRKLDVNRTAVVSLEPLRGMQLTSLALGSTGVTDLSPLQGMPLKKLEVWGITIKDLSPLHGMPLEDLWLGRGAGDLSVLRGMPLERLKLHDCAPQSDFSPIAESKGLTSLTLPVGAANIEFLRTFPKLNRIGFREDWKHGGRPDKTAAEFWEEYEASPAALFAAGRTSEALPLLAEASTAKPEDTRGALKVAALQVWFGEDAEHQATAGRMLAWAKDATRHDDVERVAKIACLRPITDAPMREAALLLAGKAVELGKENKKAQPWFQLALGIAEYRNGTYQQAETSLRAVQGLILAGSWKPGIIEGTANFYRAMCLFQLGKPAEARALFTATEAKMKPLPIDEMNPLAGEGADHDDLVLWLACRDAKVLLGPWGDR